MAEFKVNIIGHNTLYLYSLETQLCASCGYQLQLSFLNLLQTSVHIVDATPYSLKAKSAVLLQSLHYLVWN